MILLPKNWVFSMIFQKLRECYLTLILFRISIKYRYTGDYLYHKKKYLTTTYFSYRHKLSMNLLRS